jgi:hypothetical protein
MYNQTEWMSNIHKRDQAKQALKNQSPHSKKAFHDYTWFKEDF